MRAGALVHNGWLYNYFYLSIILSFLNKLIFFNKNFDIKMNSKASEIRWMILTTYELVRPDDWLKAIRYFENFKWDGVQFMMN